MYNCILVIFLLATCLLSCTGNKNPGKEIKADSNKTCSCQLDDEQMITYCPVDAIGDSVVICKVGTIYVGGSGLGAMTWPEYISSKYKGGAGPVADCKSGKVLFQNSVSAYLSYADRSLLVDKRLNFDVFDQSQGKWIEMMEFPTWRTKVYAENGTIKLSADSLIFKPPYHGPEAYASTAKEYEEEMKRTDHYLYMRILNRMIVCALSGDTVSRRRLQTIEKDLGEYFASHAESKKYFDEKIGVYTAYLEFLKQGGKKEYFDMTIYPYFAEQQKKKKKQ